MENPTTPQKKLRRSNSQRMIAGICGGLAEYFNVDPVIMRIAFVLLFLLGSGGFWLYILLWIVVPEDTSTETPATPSS